MMNEILKHELTIQILCLIHIPVLFSSAYKILNNCIRNRNKFNQGTNVTNYSLLSLIIFLNQSSKHDLM